MWSRLPASLLLALSLAGCVSDRIRPGEDVSLGELTLTSPVGWSQRGYGRERYWTIDGPALNSIAIFQNVREGEHLLLLPRGRRRDEGAIYRTAMSEAEVQELFADALQSLGLVNVSATGLRPAAFGSRPGFRFELRYDTPRGLSYRGLVLAEIDAGTLSYLVYDAPAEYYYERDLASVEALLASLRTQDTRQRP
ncbi:MAG: hypothetical protein MUE46_00375 [Xanthomonadales bacterium]|nr:hypothetical protein [Xanthomonadales bacterium]